MKKRVLFITHEDLSKTAVARSMFLDVASALSEDYECSILSAANFEKSSNSGGVNHIHFKRVSSGSISLKEVWSMASYIFRNRSVLKNYEVFYVRSYPAMIMLALLGRYHSIPLIFDTRGLFFHELFDSNKIKYRQLLPVLLQVEKRLLRIARAVICVTEAQINYYLTLEPNRSKFHLIYNSAPLPTKAPTTTESGSSLTIAYVGSMGVWHLPEKINSIVNHLRCMTPDLKFHCITPDIDQAKAIFSCSENTLIYSHQFRYSPKQFDFAFCLIKNSFSKRVCFPVKLCEYLAAKTPVVFSNNVDICNALNDRYRFGVAVNVEDTSEKIAQQIFDALPEIRRMKVCLPDELNFKTLVSKAAAVIKSI